MRLSYTGLCHKSPGGHPKRGSFCRRLDNEHAQVIPLEIPWPNRGHPSKVGTKYWHMAA